METQTELRPDTSPARLVQRLVEKLKAHYVYPELAETIATRLQAALDAGDYAQLEDADLAATLTQHIQQVSHDLHLRVWWRPDPLPEFDGRLDQNQDWLEEYRLQARLDNFGFHRVERLDGNVGYLQVSVFHAANVAGEAAVAAMNLLSNTGALILDLRRCRGGEPHMIALICSYLFDTTDPIHLTSIYLRSEDRTQQFWTLPYVPGKRLGQTPVYVLTSSTTFSGGEQIAYDLQALKRATIIGETTHGGAHPGNPHRLNPHFEIFIPDGRPINPVTGTDWEGTGVTPDLPVPAEQAFETAYRLALESVLQSLGEAPAGPSYQALRQEAQAALERLNG